MAAGITGCDVFHDDLDQCDLFREFRYDYNMVNAVSYTHLDVYKRQAVIFALHYNISIGDFF